MKSHFVSQPGGQQEPDKIVWITPDTRRVSAGGGFGVDVACQRADDLDNLAIKFLHERFIATHERPTALDMACGQGGQAIRMAQEGALVTAADIQDRHIDIHRLAQGNRVLESPIFVVADMAHSLPSLPGAPFDAIVCQRAIHYLPYERAVCAVSQLGGLLKPGGRLFLSASGLQSELGLGYPHGQESIERRFAPLAPDMAVKHAIYSPVCLYEDADLADLVHAARLAVSRVFLSRFGNVKGVAFG